MKKIYFIGGGAIATAIGNVLSQRKDFDVTLLTIEKEVADKINREQINFKYFPNISLLPELKASTNFSLLSEKAYVFIAIPSVATINFISSHKIHPDSLIINLAKGFGNDRQTIIECLSNIVPNPICTLKGPSFAREILNKQPTGLTVGSEDKVLYESLRDLFENSSIYLDYSPDIRGVELLSILKNIYAIAIGVVDAQFESPNLKNLIFTKAFKEMQTLLVEFGGNKETLYNYCGIGDFALTSLNDLSRNRTLGLLIGKGFFTENISDKVVLEGRIAVNVFYDEIGRMASQITDYPILHELYKVFNTEYDISGFVGSLLKDKN